MEIPELVGENKLFGLVTLISRSWLVKTATKGKNELNFQASRP
jgi:hypothetical protein